MSLGLDYSIYEKIALSAKESKDFDYVIVDADSEFDEEKASLIAIADKVVIVTNQNAASIYATNILVSNINGISAEKYAFICNDFIKNEDNAATAMSTKFQINEYVEHIDNYDELKADWLSSINGIKNVSILVE